MVNVIAGLAGLAALAAASAAGAQSVGGTGGSGISSSGGLGVSAGGGAGIDSNVGNAALGTSTWPPNPWPPSLGGAANTPGLERGSTQQRATEGSSSVGPANADAVARSGNFGAATSIGEGSPDAGENEGRRASIAGTGPEALYRIAQPTVNVDLDGIRRAVRRGPNATPDADGN